MNGPALAVVWADLSSADRHQRRLAIERLRQLLSHHAGKVTRGGSVHGRGGATELATETLARLVMMPNRPTLSADAMVVNYCKCALKNRWVDWMRAAGPAVGTVDPGGAPHVGEGDEVLSDLDQQFERMGVWFLLRVYAEARLNRPWKDQMRERVFDLLEVRLGGTSIMEMAVRRNRKRAAQDQQLKRAGDQLHEALAFARRRPKLFERQPPLDLDDIGRVFRHLTRRRTVKTSRADS